MQIKVSDIQLWEANYRRGDVDLIKRSIQQFGFNRNVAIWRDNIVLAGNHTIQALQTLEQEQAEPPKNVSVQDGYWVIDAMDATHLSDEEAQAYAIADNRASDSASNDAEQLASLLSQLQVSSPELVEATGFDDVSINNLLAFIGDAYVTSDGQGFDPTPAESLETFENATIKQIVLYFGLDEYDDFLDRLSRIMEAQNIDDNTSAMIFLLEHYESNTSESY